MNLTMYFNGEYVIDCMSEIYRNNVKGKLYRLIWQALMADHDLPIIFNINGRSYQNFKIFQPKFIWFGKCAMHAFCISKHKLRKSSTFCVQKCIFVKMGPPLSICFLQKISIFFLICHFNYK